MQNFSSSFNYTWCDLWKIKLELINAVNCETTIGKDSVFYKRKDKIVLHHFSNCSVRDYFIKQCIKDNYSVDIPYFVKQYIKQ